MNRCNKRKFFNDCISPLQSVCFDSVKPLVVGHNPGPDYVSLKMYLSKQISTVYSIMVTSRGQG